MALPHSTEKIIGWRTQYAAMLRWHKRCELCHDGRSNWLTGENCLLAKTSRPGNVVTATRIDRLAGSAFAPFGIVKRIVDAKAQFRSLAEPWADTGTSTGRLMLAVLGGLADVERDLIRTRTAEGRSRAKAQGKHMGRPPSLTPTQQKEAIRRRAQGATLDELARSYNVSRATISRVTA